MSLAKKLLVKQKTMKIGSLAQLAKQIKVSITSLNGVLGGRGPNQRTLKKYAKFLGATPKAIQTLAPRKPRSKPRRSR